jgi:hypothetical protein
MTLIWPPWCDFLVNKKVIGVFALTMSLNVIFDLLRRTPGKLQRTAAS